MNCRRIGRLLTPVGLGTLPIVLGAILIGASTPRDATNTRDDPPAGLAPLPDAPQVDTAVVELGRHLFFEPRLSGDGSISCATCHIPEKGWSDGLALSEGYPGTRYFRRTRSIVNAAYKPYFYWDGRLSGSDLPTLVRDHISEAHFLQADGRLVLERLRQIPYYEDTFKKVMGGEPSYGRVLNAVAAFVQTIRSRNVPFDAFITGRTGALSPPARRGYELFTGKAGCVQCHNGPMLTDGGFHVTGAPDNPDVFADPLRHITYRRFLRTLGITDVSRVRVDLGRYAVTKDDADIGRFRTPSLREVARTAPYMHGGTLETLQDVVAFYDRGGGDVPGRSAMIRPLGLTTGERAALVAFLESLSGDEIAVETPKPLAYDVRTLGDNR